MNTLARSRILPREGAHQGRLLRGYLHKTSNSLCGIKGYASLITQGEAVQHDATRWAEKIIREVERMEGIFRAVGELVGPRPAGSAGEGVGGIVAAAADEARRRHPGLCVVVGTLPEAPVLLPAADLHLVLRELLDNAAEGRTGRAGATRVTITAAAEPTGRLTLRVADDGPGMEAAMLGQAAEPFITTKTDHPGVGLTRVETILDMYDLAWHLDSEPGAGTVFVCETARYGAHETATA